MNRPVRSTSTMSSAMLSLPMAMVQPWASSSAMRGLRPRRAAMAALNETVTPASPRSFSSLRLHAAAMGADQPVVQEAQIGQVLGGQPVAMRLDRRDLAPDLVEMDGGPGVELLLQGAHVLQQLGRAHVGRPGRHGDAHAAVGLAVPVAESALDGREVPLAERAVELEGRRIADRGADPVVGALAQQEAHAGLGQRPGVVRRRRWSPRAPAWCRCAAPPARPARPSARRSSGVMSGSGMGERPPEKGGLCGGERSSKTPRARVMVRCVWMLAKPGITSLPVPSILSAAG